ncbi:MAG: hypothetical protein WHS46_01325 [Desulfosoma sp.]
MITRKRLIVLLMDLLLLAELAVSMYWSAPYGKAMANVFLKTYLPMAFVTVLTAWILVRRLSGVSLTAHGEN